MIRCLEKQKNEDRTFFLIVGDGTEFSRIQNYIDENNPDNIKLMKRLPKNEFDIMVGACDVGMIFLDYRFTIPNFPSRLLSYMQARIPVLAVTDKNTDIGKIIVEGGFGWWCESNDVEAFNEAKEIMLNSSFDNDGYDFLVNNYSASKSCSIILSHFTKGCNG